eukprot:TRINITY_DN13864_c0_g1_i1.p1 TRINITY_DN13864_c0_g1~~TRINITY_DN13864_c0_g1_i1.p1  ORF type:complete len:1488 (-),score=323.02 TRINITY_DN13864_c0_g1_i1:34-4497(-)
MTSNDQGPSLSAFTLGNVDEHNRVETGLDAETSKYVQQFLEKEGDVSLFNEGRATSATETAVEHVSDAVNFENERETADDLSELDRHQDDFARKARESLSASRAQRGIATVDDDWDAPMPGADSGVLAPLKVVMPAEVPAKIGTVHTAIAAQPILNFLDLFGPKERVRRASKRRKIRGMTVSAAAQEVLEESDDEALLNQEQSREVDAGFSDDELEEQPLQTETAADTNKAILSVPVRKYPRLAFAEPLQAGATGLLGEVPETSLHPLQQQAWEEEIKWGESEDEEEDEEEACNFTSRSILRSDSDSDGPVPPSPKRLRQLLGADDMQVPMNGTQSSHYTEMSIDGGVSDAPQPEQSVAVVTEYPLASEGFTLVNYDLDEGSWADEVIWDDQTVPSKRPALILDLNDPKMFLDELPEQPEDDEDDDRPELSRNYNKENRVFPLFNASNDDFYQATRHSKTRKLGRAIVPHSLPAVNLSLVKMNWSDLDKRLFHRPHTSFHQYVRFKITPVEMSELGATLSTDPRQLMKRRSQLSAINGKLILLEYMEEHPPLVMNVGMATRVLHYYRKRDAADTYRPAGPLDGEVVELDAGDQSPFLGEVPSGEMVSAVANSLFSSAMFKHRPRTTDFLIVRPRIDSPELFIREIPTIYCVAQEQPTIEVFQPGSRATNEFIRNRTTAFIMKLFRKTTKLRMDDIKWAFPEQPEQSLRKRLKEYAEYIRTGDEGGGHWVRYKGTPLMSLKEIRNLATPEQVCAFESMLAGQLRLSDKGITQLIAPAGVDAMQTVQESFQDDIKEAAMYVEEELKLTPWNISSNFIAAMNGRAQLTLTGFGDPSGAGQAYSYMLVPARGSKEAKKAKAEQPQIGPTAAVTGTDADLRKLTLPQTENILRQAGFPEDQIQKLGRWARIGIIRKISTWAHTSGEQTTLTKFARGLKQTSSQQQEEYQMKAQRIFGSMVAVLSAGARDDNSDDESDSELDEDLDMFGKDLEMELAAETEPAAAPGRNAMRSLKPAQSRTADAKLDARNEEAELKGLLDDLNDDQVGLRKLQQMMNVNWNPPDESDSEDESDNESVDDGGPRRQYLKRTVDIINPDGTTSQRVDIISDKTVVVAYMHHKDRLGLDKQKQLADEEQEIQRRKERRRLQEKLRRMKKNQQKMLAAGADPAAVAAAGQASGKIKSSTKTAFSGTLKCTRCGGIGHMRTNRSCPKYQEQGGGEDEDISAVTATENPLKLKINKTKIGVAESDHAHTRRSRGGNRATLSETLNKVWLAVKAYKHPLAVPFLVAVKPKDAPDYYSIIKNPIDLGKIMHKIKHLEYSSVSEFLADFDLLQRNCEEYNATRYVHLIPQVQDLVQFAKAKTSEVLSEPIKKRPEKRVREEPDSDSESSEATSATPFTPYTPALSVGGGFGDMNTPAVSLPSPLPYAPPLLDSEMADYQYLDEDEEVEHATIRHDFGTPPAVAPAPMPLTITPSLLHHTAASNDDELIDVDG